MRDSPLSQGKLIRMVAVRVVIVFVVMVAMFFLPAGTFAYWEAWLYLAILFVPMLIVMIYFLKTDPSLLERRMRMREKEPEQRRIIKISYLYVLITFMLPAFDRRFEWSDVPTVLVVLADVFVLLGYGIVVIVFKENPWASRIIEVEENQTVITTGPYAIVRHPMYLGAALMYVFSPLALGSYWAVIPSLFIVPILVARIRNEEKVLLEKLKGYREYMRQTKYRLIPAIW